MRRFLFLGTVFVLVTAASTAGAQKIKDPAARQRFVQSVLANFDRWDTNGDGILEPDELTRLVQDPNVVGEAAAAVAAIKTSLASKKAPKLPPLSRDFFQSEDPSLAYLTTAFKRAETRLKHGLSSPLFDPEGITLTGCKQGALGDCYLVAAAGAVISRDPGTISRMIHTVTDQTNYRVTYGDGFEVDVPGLTQGELAMGGAETSDGLWLRVLEKAWGVRKIQTSNKIDPSVDPRDVISGGSARAALEALTGHVAKQYHLGASVRGPYVTVDELRTALLEALRTHHLIVAGTTTVQVPGINGKHAYAVLGLDTATDEVQVWNPHVNKFTPKGPSGILNGYPTIAGRFSMPLTDFQSVFNGVAIETDQPKKPPKSRGDGRVAQ